MRVFLRQFLFVGVSLVLFVASVRAEGLRFVENKGQWPREYLYRAELPGGYLFLKKQSFVYVLYDARRVSALHTQSLTSTDPDRYQIGAHGVEVHFEGSLSGTQLRTKHQHATQFAYFLGNDPTQWAGGVSAFGEVVYQDLYPGIDLRVYAFEQTIKYEFIVKPQADASQIRLRYEGADKLELTSKEQVVVETTVGAFREAKPYSFQEIQDRTHEVATKYVVEGNRVLFQLPNDYQHGHTLTIDPELVFSTYSGSLADNWGHTATYDADGHLYTGGTVFGSNFPVRIGAYKVDFGGVVDAGLMKFSPDGRQLLYATFLGGSSTDIPNSLIVNNKGELVVFGSTSSTNFVTTEGAFQPRFGGGASVEPISGFPMVNGSDIFVAILSANGSQLVASTLLGGRGNDGLSSVNNVVIRNYGDSFRGEVVVDNDDNVWIVAATNSEDFPLNNSIQPRLRGRQDAVLVRFSPDLKQLLWSTFFGGNALDVAYSLKLAGDGSVYITGMTQSDDLAVHTGALKTTLGGTEDAFIAHFANDQLRHLTYLGTNEPDGAYLLDLDPSGNVHVVGLTRGTYPTTAGVYKTDRSGQFIHALDPTLSTTIFSTTIGSGRGIPDISPTAFLVNECGNIYLSGWGGIVNVRTQFNLSSNTSNLPVTTDAIQRTTNGNNFYIAILEAGAKSLLYATYFGSVSPGGNVEDRGDHVDGGTSRFDKNGVIYHATCACGGTRFPTTPQAWSRTNNSDNCNNAAFKIDIDLLRASFDVYEGTRKDVTTGCVPLKLTFENTSEGGVDYIWEVNGNGFSRDQDRSELTFDKAGEYTIRLRAFNRLTCKREDVATRTIRVFAPEVSALGDTTVCSGVPVGLTAKGGNSYEWSPAVGLSDPQSATPVAIASETTRYTVRISDAATGCISSRTVVVTIDDNKPDFVVSQDTTVCAGQQVQLSAEGEATIKWILPGDTASDSATVTIRPQQTATYTVEALYADGCRPRKQVTVTVDDFKPDFTVSPDQSVCKEQTVSLQASGGALTYQWAAHPSLSDTTGASVSATPTTTTSYQVTALYEDGCKPTKVVTLSVDTSFLPDFEVVRVGDKCDEASTYAFLNTNPNASRYEWNTGNGATMFSTRDVEDVVYASAGTYSITLTAYNAAGCALSTTKSLAAAAPVIVPNVITPNGDGKNDFFVIPLSGATLDVFDRWGKRLIRQENYQNDWGMGVQNGTYFYELTTAEGNRCKGWVQVLR